MTRRDMTLREHSLGSIPCRSLSLARLEMHQVQCRTARLLCRSQSQRMPRHHRCTGRELQYALARTAEPCEYDLPRQEAMGKIQPYDVRQSHLWITSSSDPSCDLHHKVAVTAALCFPKLQSDRMLALMGDKLCVEALFQASTPSSRGNPQVPHFYCVGKVRDATNRRSAQVSFSSASARSSATWLRNVANP